MTEVTARRAATRDRLVEAAMTVFAEKGVQGASVEEICDAADFTRGAFYSNFSSKDDLCIAVLEKHYREQRAALESAVASLDRLPAASSVEELIRAALTVFFAAQTDDRRSVLATQELRLHAARSPELARAYSDFHHRSACAVGEILERTVRAHGYTLTMSPPEAVGIMHAVHDYGAIGSLIDADAPGGDAHGVLLAELTRALLRPA